MKKRDTSPNVVRLIRWLNAPDCKQQGHFGGNSFERWTPRHVTGCMTQTINMFDGNLSRPQNKENPIKVLHFQTNYVQAEIYVFPEGDSAVGAPPLHVITLTPLLLFVSSSSSTNVFQCSTCIGALNRHQLSCVGCDARQTETWWRRNWSLHLFLHCT